jgi:hypothetical protein
MISKKQAVERMLEFDRIIFSTQKNVELAIIMASSTGNQCVTFFYHKKTVTKLKSLLRRKGFYVEAVTFKSSPEQELITVWWDSSILESHQRTKEEA